MAAKFTAGPWAGTGDSRVVAGEHGEIEVAHVSELRPNAVDLEERPVQARYASYYQRHANVQLIALAPELVEALRGLLARAPADPLQSQHAVAQATQLLARIEGREDDAARAGDLARILRRALDERQARAGKDI